VVLIGARAAAHRAGGSELSLMQIDRGLDVEAAFHQPRIDVRAWARSASPRPADA